MKRFNFIFYSPLIFPIRRLLQLIDFHFCARGKNIFNAFNKWYRSEKDDNYYKKERVSKWSILYSHQNTVYLYTRVKNWDRPWYDSKTRRPPCTHTHTLVVYLYGKNDRYRVINFNTWNMCDLFTYAHSSSHLEKRHRARLVYWNSNTTKGMKCTSM